MRKLIALATVVVFVLGTTVPASAVFTIDASRILSAEADLQTGVADLKNLPTLRLRSTANPVTILATFNSSGGVGIVTPLKLTWTSPSGTWVTADQLLEINYQANLPGWGIQLYTDNTNGPADPGLDANPKWVEQPNLPLKPDSPAGLVGVSATYIAVPMAWKAFPSGPTLPAHSDGSGFSATTDYKANYTEPKEQAYNDPATDDYYIELYQFKSAGGDLYGKYCWLVDKGTEKWVDVNNNNTIDAGEVLPAWSNADSYNTVVNYLGSSTCTYDIAKTFIFRDACTSPVYVTLAAKAAVATIKSIYKTNTLTLELYHE